MRLNHFEVRLTRRLRAERSLSAEGRRRLDNAGRREAGRIAVEATDQIIGPRAGGLDPVRARRYKAEDVELGALETKLDTLGARSSSRRWCAAIRDRLVQRVTGSARPGASARADARASRTT
jgi:hypothetical protein